MMVAIWTNTGYFMIIYIAGILEIPDMYYEAAEIDGANSFQKFWAITLPLLKNSTLLIVVLGTIWSFQVFELVYSLTGGGPGFSTTTLVMHIYSSSFRQFRMGYGSTLAYILFAIVAVLTIFQMKLLKSND
ncbi:Lactose transport system permease protein LacF [subsurface metagenome]